MKLDPFGVRLESNGAYWRAVWYDQRGQKVAKSIGAKASHTKRSALQACRDIAVKHIRAPGTATGGARPTLKAWCERFMVDHAAGLSDGTQVLYKTTVKRLEAYFGADVRLDKIDRAGAVEWRTWLTAEKAVQTGEPITESTVCRHIREARVIFGKAVEVDLLPFNPFDRVKGTAPVRERDWKQLTATDIDTLIEAAPDAAWRALIGLCALAGLRRGEALRLRWADVEWSRNRLFVRPEAGRVSTKQGPTREVLIVPRLEALLLDALADCYGGDRVVNVGANNLHKRMDAIIARAGFEAWTAPFHTLRKFRATTWRSEFPEHVVDSMLGHSLEVARKHYATVPPSVFVRDTSADAKAPKLPQTENASH